MVKNFTRYFVLLVFLTIPFFLSNVLADAPPDPGGGPGGGDGPVGGGSPVGSGLVFLISFGIAYGVNKARKMFKF